MALCEWMRRGVLAVARVSFVSAGCRVTVSDGNRDLDHVMAVVRRLWARPSSMPAIRVTVGDCCLWV